jgi:hypothetical protein
MVSSLTAILQDIASRHDQRMRNDPRYRMTVAIMREATKPAEPSRRYDRDGYCDNPGRGY